MTLRELVLAHRRGRSWNKLGAAIGVHGATVRGWAAGRHPMPAYQAEHIATWLGVSESEVQAAAERSRVAWQEHGDYSVTPSESGATRTADDLERDNGEGRASSESGPDGGLTPMERSEVVEAQKDLVKGQREMLTILKEIRDALTSPP